jgi:hypothetical protein
MPIGTSKVGALGGLVPGGTETFNASGTFCVPPGVKKVSVTGAGGTGNPGNPGNTGNPGVFGTGAGAGAGGGGTGLGIPPTQVYGVYGVPGGYAMSRINGPQLPSTNPQNGGPFGIAGGNSGGATNSAVPVGVTQNGPAGTSGQTGSAGSAGSAGNPGNSGSPSSAFCITFPAGAGGNAGSAGTGGTGGAGGSGGNGGNGASGRQTAGNGGSGGSGGGSGASGSTTNSYPQPLAFIGLPPAVFCTAGGTGGGGAGTTNPGGNGIPGTTVRPGFSSANQNNPDQVLGGNYDAFSLNPRGGGVSPNCPYYKQGPANRFGGSTAARGTPATLDRSVFRGTLGFCQPYQPTILSTNEMWRSGGGGGAGGYAFSKPNCPSVNAKASSGGGGGGGGRGGAGNAGGAGGAGGSGVAGTPSTSNCVPVTPGGSVPIVVGTGGSVVISWNPQ